MAVANIEKGWIIEDDPKCRPQEDSEKMCLTQDGKRVTTSIFYDPVRMNVAHSWFFKAKSLIKAREPDNASGDDTIVVKKL